MPLPLLMRYKHFRHSLNNAISRGEQPRLTKSIRGRSNDLLLGRDTDQAADSSRGHKHHMISYSVLAGTMSLKPWFFLLPGAITSRLMCPVIGVLPNGLLFEPGQMTYSLELGERSSLGIGIFSALLWFCFFWFAGRKWFGKQVEK